MTMRVPPLDPEAMADPIAGSLELSRAVRERLPLLLGALILSGLFTGGWLVLLIGGAASYALDLAATGDIKALGALFLLSVPLWLCVLALGLLSRGVRFFGGFGAGHIAVERASRAEPGAVPYSGAPLHPAPGGLQTSCGQGGVAPSTVFPAPFASVLRLAREPSSRADEIAGALRLMSVLFVPLLLIVAADALLLAEGGTLLWRTPPEGGGLVDAVLLLLGAGALWASAGSIPMLVWVARRLAAIEMLEKAGPATIPAGPNPMERFLGHLGSDPRHKGPIEEWRRAGAMASLVKGASGASYEFDLHLVRPSGAGARRSLYLKRAPGPPTLRDIDDIEAAVKDVTGATGSLPERVIILYTPPRGTGPGAGPGDEVYDRLMERHISGRVGWTGYACAIELVSEQPDGTYDMVPFKLPGG